MEDESDGKGEKQEGDLDEDTLDEDQEMYGINS
jgi:hypothetical protein